LQAAGIPAKKAYGRHKGSRRRCRPFGRLPRGCSALKPETLGHVHVETLAATMLGALHGWASTARACGQPTAAAAGARHVDRFVDLPWNGIGPE
jgi:hypothetical protein